MFRSLACALLLSTSVLAQTSGPPPGAPVPKPPEIPYEWARGALFYRMDGDVKTLTSKLDYLQDLGTDAVSLRVACPPAELKPFLEQAKKRGLRVILELTPEQATVATARQWLKAGVDGFRVEKTDQTEALWDEVRRIKGDAIVVVERPGDLAEIAMDFATLPVLANVPMANAIGEGVKSSVSTRMRVLLFDMLDAYPYGAIDAQFLTRDDENRIAKIVGGDPAKLRDAAALLLTLPGAAFLHAGDEIGLESGPMTWTAVAAQQKDPESLLSYYRGWIAARKKSPALSKGWFLPYDVSVRALVFVRWTPSEKVIVMHNLADVKWSIPIPAAVSKLTPVHVDKGVGVPNTDTGTWVVSMPPHTTAVWRMD